MWRIAHKGIKNRRCFKKSLNEIASKLRLPVNQEEWNDPRKVASNLRRANKVRKKLERDAIAVRDKEREDNIVKNLPEGKDKEKALKEARHRLQQKKKFQQIKECVKGQMTAGVSQILIPEPYTGYPYRNEEITEWRTVHGEKEVEEILLSRNRKHFAQAMGTPFTCKEMMEKIPFTANSATTQKILEGEEV